MDIEEYTEWRILSKPKGKKVYRFIPFTGAAGHRSEEAANRFISTQTNTIAAGWKFELQSRRVRIETGPWE